MATDIHLPVETSPVSKTATYFTIWREGAHDLYKFDPFDPNGTIQILNQTPPQKFENVTDDIQLQELKKSIDMELVKRPNPDGTTRVVAQCESKFFAKDEKVIDVFTMIGNTFKGHATGTCGHYCLLTNLALLSESISKDSDKITITFNEESGLTELTLDQFTNTADDAITKKEKGNREKIKAWLIDNAEKLTAQDPNHPTLSVFKTLIEKLQNPNWLESEEIKYVIQKVTELTRKKESVLDPTIHDKSLTHKQQEHDKSLTHEQQEQAINAAQSVTPENATEKLEQAKEQLKGVIELDGITTNDIAIIALLTAFLAVIGGPATPALFTALLLPLVATLKFHHIPFTEDDLTKVKQLSTLPTPTGTVQAPRCQPLQTTPDRLEQPIAVC